MVKSKDGKIEVISREEDYLRKALERTKDLIFQSEQNLIINKEMVRILEKKIKEFSK